MKFETKRATSKVLMFDDFKILFLSMVLKEDGFYLVTSYDKSEAISKKISSSTDDSDKNVARVAKTISSQDAREIISKLNVDILPSEVDDLVKTLVK